MLGMSSFSAHTSSSKTKSNEPLNAEEGLLVDAVNLQSNFATVMKNSGFFQHPSSNCFDFSSSHPASPKLPPVKRRPSAKKRGGKCSVGESIDNGSTAASVGHNKPKGQLPNGGAPTVLWADNTGSGAVACLPTTPSTVTTTTCNPSLSNQDDMAILINEQPSNVAPRYTGCRNDKAKPPYSYASLIAQALLASPNKRLTLSSIYAWIMNKYPYYRSENCGWQNSIRHNLSLNRCFVRILRDDLSDLTDDSENEGKGAFWTLDESLMYDFEDGMFKRRKYGHGRAARRHSGEERRKKRIRSNPIVNNSSVVPIIADSILVNNRKLTIDDELFSRKRGGAFHNNPIIGLFAPSPGLSHVMIHNVASLINQQSPPECEEDLFEEDNFEQVLCNHEQAMEDPFVQPTMVAYSHFTCPELAESRYVYPMPPTFSDFYH